jgi:hypothetical protein
MNMDIKQRWILLSPGLIAALLLLAGCETERSEQVAVGITPNNVNIKNGESREFTASGWQDYTWSLSNERIGVLSTRKGNATVYTAVAAKTNDIQVLTVTVNVLRGSSTNAPLGILSGEPIRAEALITHLLPEPK